MGRKTVETTASGLNQFIGKQGLSPLDTEEITELGQYFPSSGSGSGFEPTEAQLDAMNSGITAAKVTAYDALPTEEDVKDILSDHFVAGTNVTITDNVDGTQTISSTASGGFTPTTDQLAAMNSGITSYWQNEFRKVLEHCNPERKYQNLTNDSGGQTGYVWNATGNYVNVPGLSTQAVLQRIYTNSNYIEYAWDVNGNHAVRYSSGDVTSPTWSNWLVIPASTPPTAYSAPTNGSWTSAGVNYTISGRIGGYVVSNNICTVNIRFNLSATGGTAAGMLSQILFTGLPKPKSGLAVLLPMNQCANSSTYAFRETSTAAALTSAGELRAPASTPGSWSGLNYFVISGSYLIDTST